MPTDGSIGIRSTAVLGGHLFFTAFDFKNGDIVLSGLDTFCTVTIKGGRIFGKDTTQGRIQSYCIHSFDSVFWLYDDLLLLTDRSGKALYKKRMNDSEHDSTDKYFYGDLAEYPVYYDAKRNNLLMYRRRIDVENNNKEWADQPAEVEYRFSDSTFYPLTYRYPALYRENYYGEAWPAYRTINGNLNIVSYMASGEVTIYDRESGSVRTVNMSTNGFTKRIQPFVNEASDIQQKMDHLLVSPIYMGIFYDRNKKLYYRLAYDAIEHKNKDGTYNPFQKKQLIISVYDADFKKICDQKMGSKYKASFGYPTMVGFNLFKEMIKDKNGNDKIYFDAFTLR